MKKQGELPILGLALVETLGIGMCFLALSLFREAGDQGKGFYLTGKVFLVFLLVITWGCLVFNRHYGPQIIKTFLPDLDARRLSSKLYWVDLGSYVWVTASLNYVFLNAMIWAGGGPKHSFFTPFLVIMLPVYVLLKVPCGELKAIFVASVVSLNPWSTKLVYWPYDQLWNRTDVEVHLETWLSEWIFFGVTSLCVLFPGLLAVVTTSESKGESTRLGEDPVEDLPLQQSENRLGDLLVEAGAIQRKTAERIAKIQRVEKQLYGRLAVGKGHCSEEAVNEALHRQGRLRRGSRVLRRSSATQSS